jgi:hypothetical protein
MSTRGCIARTNNGEGWQGVYHHWDSYPKGLGKELWDRLHSEYQGDITAFLADAIDNHPSGWSSFPDKCYCHDHNFAKRDGSLAKDSSYYKPSAPNGRMTSETSDPLFIEWVYAFDPETRKLAIFSHTTVNKLSPTQHGTFCEEWTLQYQDGTIEVIPAKYYVHKLVAIVDLDGEEPDWQMLEIGVRDGS